MSDISSVNLGDLIEFQRGYDLAKSELITGKYPVRSSNGILGYHNEYKVIGPGITIGRSGTVGIPHLIKSNFYPHNTSLFIKKFKGNDVEYIYYLLKNLKLGDKKSGSSVPTMNRNHLHPLSILAYEDIEDQQKIAKVLSDLDAKIELNNKINAELEAIAKLIYDYWFVQFDFPDENGKPYKSSGGKMVFNEVLKREIPEGWEVTFLDQITERVCVGFVGKCQPYFCSKDEGVPLIRTGNLSLSGLDLNNLIYVNHEFHEKNLKSQLFFGDLLVARHGNSGLSSIYHKKEPANCLNVVVVKPDYNSNYTSEFLYQTLKSDNASGQIKATSGGSVQGVVNTKSIANVKIAIPEDEAVQMALNDILKPLYEKIFNNKNQNEQLSVIRDWLLPMLMNGQVKVGE